MTDSEPKRWAKPDLRPDLMKPLNLVGFGLALVAISSSAALSQNITLAPVGNPGWQPVDIHLFSAPVGTPATGYQEFGFTMEALLPAPYHLPHPDLGIGPGAPHAGPYDTEFSASIAALGFHEGGLFQLSEFSSGSGIWLTWMNVPTGSAAGSSPDFLQGPIIPNTIFPIEVDGTLSWNGSLFDPFLDSSVSALDGSLNPPFDVDGHSHFPSILADAAEFNVSGDPTPRAGDYLYEVRLLDATGAGWDLRAEFQVVPEASTWGIGLVMLSGAGALGYRHRRGRRD